MSTSVEDMIQAKGLTAPRLTPADIEAAIKSEHYFNAAEAAEMNYDRPGVPRNIGLTPSSMYDLSRLTICVLVLKNGFTVTGESACVSPENFDVAIGHRVARDSAKQKIWALEGYLLKSKLAGSAA